MASDTPPIQTGWKHNKYTAQFKGLPHTIVSDNSLNGAIGKLIIEHGKAIANITCHIPRGPV